MSSLEQRTNELRELIQQLVKQFSLADREFANGPEMDLIIQEVRVIEHLGDDGPKMMREMAEFLNLAVNSVTSIIDHLEAKEIVVRKRSESDRRVVHVELSDRGRTIYQSCIDGKLRFLRTLLKTLSEEEQEIFLVLFRKIGRVGIQQVH